MIVDGGKQITDLQVFLNPVPALDIEGTVMTAGSDNTDQPSDSEKIITPETPKTGKPGITDGSSVQSQTSTGARPFMIYPIPKAGKTDSAAEAPEGRPYEEVLAINSPVRPAAAPGNAADKKPKTDEESPAVPAPNAQVPTGAARRERVSKTLLDYAVPEADKLSANLAAGTSAALPAPSTQAPAASAAPSVPSTQATAASAVPSAPSTQATAASAVPSAPSTQATAVTPAASAPSIQVLTAPILKAPSTPVAKASDVNSAGQDDDDETSVSVLHRIANSQAINHKKKEQKILLPPVPPPMRRKKGVARTMLDMFVNIGNQLTGSGQTPEPPVGDGHQASELVNGTSRNAHHESLNSPAVNSASMASTADSAPMALSVDFAPTAPAADIAPIAASVEAPFDAGTKDDYLPTSYAPAHAENENNLQQISGEFQPEQNEQQYYNQSLEETGAAQESRGDRVPRTLLDHSVLFDTVSRSSEKMILKAVEEQKERLNEPFVPFIPVEADKQAKDCPWKWEGEEGKERVKYCDRCQHQVYNFAGLERPEADALVFKRENREPKTLYKRADGKFMTSDCPVAGKKQREMVLAVVGGLFLLTIVFGCMMLVPHPVPSPTATNENSDSDAHSDQPHRHVTSTPGGSAGTHSTEGSGPSSSGSSSGTVGNPSLPPPPIPSGGGSNGGYGPPPKPIGTPVADDWQWQYNDNNSQSNPPQAQAIMSRPAPASTPPVDPAKAAEIQKLKNEIDESNESH